MIIDPATHTVIRCTSHRSRSRAGLSRNSQAQAVYSFRRATTGGFYVVPKSLGEEILSRRIPGVGRLRGPYDDLLRCW